MLLTNLLLSACLAFQGPPIFQEVRKIVSPSGGFPFEFFGHAIAADGDIVAMGAATSGVPGAVYVFRGRRAQVFEGQVTASDGMSSDLFGVAVDASDDMLAVGAPGDDDLGNGTGSVYVFERFGTAWVEVEKVHAWDAGWGDAFGVSVAIQGDELLVGSTGHDGVDPGNVEANSGAVYVFERQGSSWIPRQKLEASDASVGSLFGILAVDGDRLAVGAPGENGNQGAVYAFEKQGTTWVETAKLVGSMSAPANSVGLAVALEGSILAAGAPGAPGLGAVYVFEEGPGGWQEAALLTNTTPGHARSLGRSVALDSGMLIAGEPGDTPSGGQGGAVQVFVRGPSGWSRHSELRASDPQMMHTLGGAVTTRDGVVFASAIGDNDQSTQSGAVYVFEPGFPASYCEGKTNSLGCVPFVSSSGVPSASSTEPFFVRAHDALADQPALLFYGYAKANHPFHGGRLCVKVPLNRLFPAKTAVAKGSPPCQGVLTRNFNARIQSGQDPQLTTGQSVTLQWLQRDPASPTFFADSLTDALHFLVSP